MNKSLTLRQVPLHAVTAKEQTHYALNSVAIYEDGRALATDGKLLVAVGKEVNKPFEGDPVLYPAEVVKAIGKLAKKGNTRRAETVANLNGDNVEGTYPKVNDLFPTEKPSVEVYFSVQELQKLLFVAQNMENYEGGGVITMKLITKEAEDGKPAYTVDPITFYMKDAESEEELKALLMPCSAPPC